MKLLMISGDRSILQRRNGAFWYTLQELRKHWDHIDIICPCTRAQIHENQRRAKAGRASLVGGKVFFHPSPSSLWKQTSWITSVGSELIEKHRHDVMTVHEYPPFYNGLGARRLAKKYKISYALEVHHIVGYPKPANMHESIGRLMSRLYFPLHGRKATAIRAVNMTVLGVLRKWGIPKSKLHLVPSFYLDEEVLKKPLRPPVIYEVSFCGRLVANKGLSELIKAVSILPGVRLLIIGDGPLRSQLESQVNKLGIKDRVHFVGWLKSFEAVIGAIQTAEIFVMNSLSEVGPRSALEAMACGMPVISTRVGVMPEVIEDGVNGVFTTGTAEDLAEKMRMLLSDEAMKEGIGKEATKILDRFKRSTLVAHYAHFLQGLV